jgi:hypothetical protein
VSADTKLRVWLRLTYVVVVAVYVVCYDSDKRSFLHGSGAPYMTRAATCFVSVTLSWLSAGVCYVDSTSSSVAVLFTCVVASLASGVGVDPEGSRDPGGEPRFEDES